MTQERENYLIEVANDFGIDENIVFSLAEVLGEDEDYDGLIMTLEDLSDVEFWGGM